jgi:hypothetical protein
MEQLRKILTWLTKYHFWVLSVVAALIGVFCWYTGAQSLTEQFKTQQGTIQQAFSTQQSVAGRPFLPNPAIVEEQKEQVELRAQEVLATWQQLYDRQRNEALKWPGDRTLTQSFRDEVEKKRFGDPLSGDALSEYQNYIGRHFDALPEIIGALKADPGGGRSVGLDLRNSRFNARETGREVMFEPVEPEFIVDWNAQDQEVVRQMLDFQLRPSSTKVWVTQETLWAYHTLLEVIAATNRAVGADRQSNAAVRTVHALEVGKTAAQESRGKDHVELAEAVRAAATAAVATDATGRDIRTMVVEGREGQAAMTEAEERVVLLNGRYVNADGQPILFTGSEDVATVFGKEYKRLPVRMQLEMNVNQLPFLITECANQPLPVEVQEVRVNPSTGVGASGGRGREVGPIGRGPMTRSVGGTEVATFAVNPNIVPVIIHGVIYFYNQPNPATIGVGDQGIAAVTE